ncbi:hypothetical protein [Azospirillum sp. B510]|nr:hypothetical protein [Azospirillum sp. B510]
MLNRLAVGETITAARPSRRRGAYLPLSAGFTILVLVLVLSWLT